MNLTTSILVASAALALAGASHAAITGVAGSTTWLGVNPANAQAFNLIGFNAYAWDEQAGVLTSGVNVNLTANGVYTGPSPFVGAVSGTFDSHMIHFDPGSAPVLAAGSVTFSGTILGVIYDESFLSLTDGAFGAGTTTYDTGNFLRSYNASVLGASTLTVSGNTLSFSLVPLAGQINRMFEIRVLTAVPTPGTAALIGLAGLVGFRRSRR